MGFLVLVTPYVKSCIQHSSVPVPIRVVCKSLYSFRMIRQIKHLSLRFVIDGIEAPPSSDVVLNGKVRKEHALGIFVMPWLGAQIF